MSFSYNDFGPKGPGDTITVDFEYERREDVKVLVDGDPVDDSLWEWVNDGLILAKAGFPLGTAGRVQRTTNISSLTGRLVGTAVLDYPTVNGNFDRLLYRLQENDDFQDEQGGRVSAVEEVLAEQKDSLDDSVELGRRWAEEDEDVEVAGGGYSSKHHAAKSSDSAGASEASRIVSVEAAGVSVAARDASRLWASEAEDVAVDDGVNPPGYSAYHWYRKALAAAGSVLSGLAGLIHGATNKTTPADNDELALVDSAASWGLKKLTWANLKAALKAAPFVPVTGSTNDADWDTYTDAGWNPRLITGTAPNSPGGTEYYFLHNADYGSGFTLLQTAFPRRTVSGRIGLRSRHNAVWESWRYLPWADTVLHLAGGTMAGKLTLPAGVTDAAPLNIPPGVAPDAPVDGDVWGQSTGLRYRRSGVTYQVWDTGSLLKMPTAEAQTGTATTARVVDAATIKAAINALAPAPSTAAGAVGTYAFVMSTATALTPGTTYAGSTLQYAGIKMNTSGNVELVSGGVLSGTWRAMGRADNTGSNFTTLAVRIS